MNTLCKHWHWAYQLLTSTSSSIHLLATLYSYRLILSSMWFHAYNSYILTLCLWSLYTAAHLELFSEYFLVSRWFFKRTREDHWSGSVYRPGSQSAASKDWTKWHTTISTRRNICEHISLQDSRKYSFERQ